MKCQVYVPNFQHVSCPIFCGNICAFTPSPPWSFLESSHRIVCFCLICLLSFRDLPSSSFRANCDVTSAGIVNHQESQFQKWKPRLLSGNPDCWIIGASSSISNSVRSLYNVDVLHLFSSCALCFDRWLSASPAVAPSRISQGMSLHGMCALPSHMMSSSVEL